MLKYNEKISDNSTWFTATPAESAMLLPFYVTEAGHFYAGDEYCVKRESHDSHLILFTVNGSGLVNINGTEITVNQNHAVIIDCHKPHEYRSNNSSWEFIWLHIRGTAAELYYKLLYSEKIAAAEIYEPDEFTEKSNEIIDDIGKNNMLSLSAQSKNLHELLNIILSGTMKTERTKNKDYEYIKKAERLIRNRYADQLSIDDIIHDIPISKYHFIRLFKRLMGTTPYHYLTSCRINNAKIMLRTTDLSVAEISDRCGFLDTSNFIAQFKKNTNQKPLQYRKYFMG